jgi:hypothetical protein
MLLPLAFSRWVTIAALGAQGADLSVEVLLCPRQLRMANLLHNRPRFRSPNILSIQVPIFIALSAA